jgi:hypothetical protein
LKREYEAMAKRSHLVVRITTANGLIIDYVDVCGSE